MDKRTESNPLRSCGVLLFRSQPRDSFLLMKHANRLDLPKGHVDGDETDLQCALREMEEETGVSRSLVDIDADFRFTLQYPVKGKRTGGKWMTKTLVIFLGRLEKPVTIQHTEHLGSKWVDWNPPHEIQEQTIDPLLAEVALYRQAMGW